MLSLPQELTDNFYRWEKRGRGWRVWNYPVQLEPPFEPFYHQYSPAKPVVDDARKPTLLSTFAERLRGRKSGRDDNRDEEISIGKQNAPDLEPAYAYAETPLILIRVSLPPELVITKDIGEQFLLSLSRSSQPLSFELIGLADSITVQIVCREPDINMICQQLQAYFPETILTRLEVSEDLLTQKWNGDEGLVVDFGLSQEFMRPLRAFRSFEVDPLIAIMGALGGMRNGELGAVQVLFQGARQPWAESVMRAVTDGEGRSFFLDAPDMLGLAKDKVEHPLFAAVLRIAAVSADLTRSGEILKGIAGALTQFANPGSNELIPLDNDDYDDFAHETELVSRQSRRSGMILNSRELASLIHLPSVSVRAEKLQRQLRKTKAAPSIALGHQLVLGENSHRERNVQVTISPEQRLRHMHVIGATGTGKSTLLLNLIAQDIQNRNGVGVIDPHGDLIDQILGHIPEKRFDDVILFDPADTDYPIGFNVLSAHSELEKNILASDLGAVFRRLSTSWGDQMTSVLGNAILAFLESNNGGTLLDLRRFLIEAEFRNAFLKTVKDQEIVYFWQKEFPLLSGKPQASILTRLDTFLRPKIIRNMVSQKENRINFDEVLNKDKIILVKLAQGLIGEENAYLLGAFIVSKFHQVAMGRQEIDEAERRNFFLYIDEFQNFITPSMAAILSGARKYHLGLVLSHQDMEQLWKRDSEVASSVISNPATRVCFRLGDLDARRLEQGFSSFDASDFQNLSVGEAICRIERADYDFNLKSFPLLEADVELARHRHDSLIVLSRNKYGRRGEEAKPEILQEKPAKTPPELQEQVTRLQPQKGAAEPLKTRSSPVPKPPPLGRGGQQHKYLQNLVKRIGEAKGYHVTIEKPILGGLGSVDVTLEKNTTSIACEICITTSPENEVANIQKCLAAGFGQVVLISPENRTLKETQVLLSTELNGNQLERLKFFVPEEFITFLEEQNAGEAGRKQTVKGYKVKVTYKHLENAEKKLKNQAITKIILEAMKRLRET